MTVSARIRVLVIGLLVIAASGVTRSTSLPDQTILKGRESLLPAASTEPIATAASPSVPEAQNKVLAVERSGRESERIEGSFIVDLAPGLDPRLVASKMAAEYGGHAPSIYDEVIGGFAFQGPDDAAERMSQDPRVQNVSADYEVHEADEVRTELVAIDAPGAWSAGYDGQETTIAVLDGGVDTDHPYLAGRIAGATNFVDSEPTVEDGRGHGTHVIGIAVGGVGVLPQGRVYSGKVMRASDGAGSWTDVIDGINWVKGLVNSGVKIRAVNLSIAGTTSCFSSLQTAVDQLYAKNVAIIVAAGNANKDVSLMAPANCRNAFAVSGLDTRSAPYRRYSWSNYGSKIAVAAPAVAVTSLKNDGTCCVAFSGTSMAAPHATAVIANAMAVGNLTPAAALLNIQSTGACPDGNPVPCTGQSWPGDTDGYTEAQIHMYRSVVAANPAPTGSFPGLANNSTVSGAVSVRVLPNDDKPLPMDPVKIKLPGETEYQSASPRSDGSFERIWATCPDGPPCPADPAAPVSIKATITDSTSKVTTIGASVFVGNYGTWTLAEQTGTGTAYTGTSWVTASNTNASGASYRYSRTAGNTVRYTFTGTGVRWISATGTGGGIANVKLDGVSVGQVNMYSSGTVWKKMVYEAKGLSNSSHTLEIAVTGTKSPAAVYPSVYVDAFQYLH